MLREVPRHKSSSPRPAPPPLRRLQTVPRRGPPSSGHRRGPEPIGHLSKEDEEVHCMVWYLTSIPDNIPRDVEHYQFRVQQLG
ncbi:Immunoglobulin superfamily member 10 [Manis javanica]|nr:Immunoglobulin superfamily member 10 [Manis javanica]